MRLLVVLVGALGLAQCASKMIYLTADGHAPNTDPVLQQQFDMDATICRGEMQKTNLSGLTASGGGFATVAAAADRAQAANQVGQGCMVGKGYVLVREDQVPTMQQQLAAAAAEKAAREAAAAVPPAPLPPPIKRRVAAKPQPRPAPKPSRPPAQPVSQSLD
jgi:hypothetical protein